MAVSETFLERVRECLDGVERVTVRRMFGGAGVYADGLMFALIADDELYLKADDATRAAFQAESLGPFVYEAKGKRTVMSYWRAPERLLDDPGEMTEWARTALNVAKRANRDKPGSRRSKRKS